MNGYITDGKIRVGSVEKTPRRIKIIYSTLLLCATSMTFSALMSIYLEVENYTRMKQIRQLRNDLELCESSNYSDPCQLTEYDISKWMQKYSSSTSLGRINITKTTRNRKPGYKRNTKRRFKFKRINWFRKSKRRKSFALFENGDTLKYIKTELPRCLTRVESFETRQMDFENSIDLLREQLHDRLAVIENATPKKKKHRESRPTFSAQCTESYGTPVLNSDGTMYFKNILLNEGRSFQVNSGLFISPKNGVYVFFLSVAVDTKLPSMNLYCYLVIERNRKTLIKTRSRINNSTVESNVYLSVALVTRLRRYDVIRTSLRGCRITTAEGTFFQGFYLRR